MIVGLLSLLPFHNAPTHTRQAMIDEFDLDQDGEINEQEFIQIMMDEG